MQLLAGIPSGESAVKPLPPVLARKPRKLRGNREQELRFAEREALLARAVPHGFMGGAGLGRMLLLHFPALFPPLLFPLLEPQLCFESTSCGAHPLCPGFLQPF